MSGPADLAHGWVQKGDSDAQTARMVLTGPGPYDTACFHAQQAAAIFRGDLRPVPPR